MIPEHLHVAPAVGPAALGLGQVAQVARVVGVGDIDEGGSVHAADQRVLAAVERVGPSPHVVQPRAPAGAQLRPRDEREQVHVIAVIAGGTTVGAGDFAAVDGGEARVVDLEHSAARPLAGVAGEHGGGTQSEIDRGVAEYGDIARQRQRLARRDDAPLVVGAEQIHGALQVERRACAFVDEQPRTTTHHQRCAVRGDRHPEARSLSRVLRPQRAHRRPLTVGARKAVHGSLNGHVAVVTPFHGHLSDEDLVLEQRHGRSEGHRARAIGVGRVHHTGGLPSLAPGPAFEDPESVGSGISDDEQAFPKIEPWCARPAGLRGNADRSAGCPPAVGPAAERGQNVAVVTCSGHGKIAARCGQGRPEPAQPGAVEDLDRARVPAFHIVEAVREHLASVDTLCPHEQHVARSRECRAEPVPYLRFRSPQRGDDRPFAVVGVYTNRSRITLVGGFADVDASVGHQYGATEGLGRHRRGNDQTACCQDKERVDVRLPNPHGNPPLLGFGDECGIYSTRRWFTRCTQCGRTTNRVRTNDKPAVPPAPATPCYGRPRS